jgi:hypothetical protein
MKLIPLTNVSGAKLRIAAARLVFEPGQTKKVHPATVQHPAVQKYIGGYLKQGTQETVAKAEPKAPVAQPAAKPTVALPVSEPNASKEETPVPVNEPTVSDPETTQVDNSDSAQDESGNLREVFLSAPGITDKNIDAVLAAFDSLELLAAADEDDLIDCGISRSYAKRVVDWAESELG